MKTLLAAIAIAFVSTTAEAQEITLNIQNASLDEFVKATQKQAGITFVYGHDVAFETPMNINVRNIQLEDVLKKVMPSNHINYMMSGKHITLTKAKRSNGIATEGGRQETVRTHTISGYVKDKASRETLIGATIYATDEHKGVVTNAYGFFSLTLHEGQKYLHVSYIGYESQTHSLTLTEDMTITLELIADNKIEEIVVEADRPETGAASSRTGSTTIPVEMIKKQPALLGEPDVLKALQTLPGVQRGLAGTSGVHVRGGGPDQNLYLLDGVPMYNIDHVLGFMSAFTPDAVKHVDFYKASFPARYGGRLSSVIDVRTKDGDMQNWHGMAQIGTLSSHLSVEGPINKDKTSLILSARRSYFDLIAAPIVTAKDPDINSIKLNFYDINAKVNHIFSDEDRLYASFYMGRDVLGFGSKTSEKSEFAESKTEYNIDLRWGNTLGSIRWNHIFTPKLFSNVTIAYNRFNFAIDSEDISEISSYYNGDGDHQGVRYKETEKENLKMEANSGIDDLTAIMDMDFHPASHHHMKFGGQYILHNFRPNISTTNSYSSNNDTTMNDMFKNDENKTKGNELDIYADDDISIGDKLQTSIGIRATLFAVKGKMYKNIEPRFSAAYLLAQGWRAKASYTMMHQYVHLLQSAPISLPTNLWVPIDKNIKPMSSNQYSVGVSCSVLPGWEFTLEGYYKDMRHILDYKDGAGFNGSTKNWQELVAEGRSRSRGMELSARRTVGRTTGSLSYTLSKTDRKFGRQINAGEWHPYKYDRRNIANIVVMHKFNEKIDIAASWSFMSGSWETVAKQRVNYILPQGNQTAYSPNGAITSTDIQEFDYYDHRNNYRLSPSHQLDLSVNFHKELKHCSRTINVSIINAYNRHNQDLVYAERKIKHKEVPLTPDDQFYIEGGNGNYRLIDDGYMTTLNQTSLIPIIPAISYTLRF